MSFTVSVFLSSPHNHHIPEGTKTKAPEPSLLGLEHVAPADMLVPPGLVLYTLDASLLGEPDVDRQATINVAGSH